MFGMLKIHPEEGRRAPAREAMSLLVTRRVTFAAAHVLRRPDWDEERNRAVFGQCARDHGHNYVLEVSVSGTVDAETGMVVNLKDLDRAVKHAIVEHVDHRHLNHDVPFLADRVPTAENLALAFWDQLERWLAGEVPGCRLRRLRLVESENNAVEVSR
jgi:6-pyruvoyltetrahydropterin/6-carboxytetrahydropterin synthase